MQHGARAGLVLLAGMATLAGTVLAARQPPQPTPQPAQGPSFRSGIEVVSLHVTATESGTRFVTDLEPGEFTVFEDGVKQDFAFFSRGQVPIALAILMDTSASMQDRLATAQEAAVGFARRVRPEDLAEVIEFDSKVEILQAFTNQVADLEAAIRRTSAGGSTSLHNAIYISLKELKKSRATSVEDIRRQAIVVLSDGEDTSSLVSFEEVLDLAKRSETVIYAIGLRSRDSVGRGFNEADFVLRQLTQETGGRVFFPNDVSELAGVYDQIARELSSQYVIGYTSRNQRRDGRWRRVVVRVSRPNVIARTKQGYYGPSSQ
jgi:Ca-activated chloride channel family protein